MRSDDTNLQRLHSPHLLTRQSFGHSAAAAPMLAMGLPSAKTSSELSSGRYNATALLEALTISTSALPSHVISMMRRDSFSCENAFVELGVASYLVLSTCGPTIDCCTCGECSFHPSFAFSTAASYERIVPSCDIWLTARYLKAKVLVA